MERICRSRGRERGGALRQVCVDAGFVIGLYDDDDQHHEAATSHFSKLFVIGNNRMVIPWPILYEAVSTKMIRNKTGMFKLESDWKRLNRDGRLQLLSDFPYRENVIQDCFDELRRPLGSQRKLSAVDRVIRGILADRNVKISAFVTFNGGDFADVCRQSKTQLVS
jgi:hypothetical protein